MDENVSKTSDETIDMEGDIVDRFQSHTRRIHVILFTGLSILLSGISSLFLIYHLLTGSYGIFVAVYELILILATGLASTIALKSSGVSNITHLKKIVKQLNVKYKIMVAFYVWAGIGFTIANPFLYIVEGISVFHTPYTGLLAGVLCFALAVQMILLNYILHGRSHFSEEELENLKGKLENEIDEFDPEEYKEREIEDIESLDQDEEEEK